MRPADNINDLIKKLKLKASTDLDGRVYDDISKALAESDKTKSAVTQPNIWSTIMKSPITKLAAAAVIIALVVLGLFEFLDTGSSSVVWAEVAQKVQASGGLTLRITETSSVLFDDSDYAIKYFSPTGSRTDAYKDGQITHSRCSNYKTMTSTYVYHTRKHYISTQYQEGIEGFLEKDEDWTNPKYLVQQILSAEHKKLGEKMIEGVPCEGLETSDPAVMGSLVEMADRLEVHMELWVDAATGYPVRFESELSAEAEGEEAIASECVMDQFQWDVEIDPSLFTLDIPAGYIDITPDKR